ncbi:hypothetical protein [Glycomyces rhizosphaerae]|uniref:Uncharacterized protein n=1 Tax=Glycomyces rhizosphaerae TaxID=2054422 RepID=A0ABV7Q7C4_9ACTN
MIDKLDAAGAPPPRTSWLRAVFSRAVLRNLGKWTLVEFAIVPLPLTVLGLWPVDGEVDSRSFRLLAYVAGMGFIYALGIIVIPSAVVAVLCFRSSYPGIMHFVPYFATIAWSLPVMLTVGILFGTLLVPQVVATVVIHALMARHYKRNIDDQMTLLVLFGQCAKCF